MNVDCAPFAVGRVATSGDGRSTAGTRDGGDAPAFSLRVDAPASHGGMSPKSQRPETPRVTDRRDAANRAIGPDRASATKHDRPRAAHAGDETPYRDEREPQRADDGRVRAKPTGTPNARHRMSNADAAASGDDASVDAPSAAEQNDASAAPPADSRDATSASQETDLADRMLALLGMPDRAPPAMMPPSQTASLASGVIPSSDGAPVPALSASVTTMGALMPADASTTAVGAMPTAGVLASTHAAVPGVAPFALAGDIGPAVSKADTGNDAFAALAALADGKPDAPATGQSGTNATPPLASAFAPQPLHGMDATSSVARAPVAGAVDPSVALALDAGFDDGIGSRVLWMADQRVDHAQIRVTPDGLGPIDVRLQMDGQRVHAQFNASHADVRHALEAGMDRLRDLLGRQGMELGQAQVGTGQRHSGDGRPAPHGASADAGNDAETATQTTTVRAMRLRGLIDEYA